MNDEFPLIIIECYQKLSILMLSVISVLQHVPLFIDGIWLCYSSSWDWNRPTAILQMRCVVNSDSTRNEQVKKGVCRMYFDGRSANVTLFNSRKVLFLERFWPKLVVAIQHIRSCLSIYWAAICFHFINQPCASQCMLHLINVSTTVT